MKIDTSINVKQVNVTSGQCNFVNECIKKC